jgi:hypothetical protein
VGVDAAIYVVLFRGDPVPCACRKTASTSTAASFMLTAAEMNQKTYREALQQATRTTNPL